MSLVHFNSSVCKTIKTVVIVAGILPFIVVPGMSQNGTSTGALDAIYNLYTQPRKNNISEEQQAVQKSKSGNSYFFMNLRKTIGAINEMIVATGDTYWINQQIQIINNLIQTAQTSSNIPNNFSFKDGYQSWVSLNPKRNFHKEIPLYESYSFLYIAQFLYLMRDSDWIKKDNRNRTWWNSTLSFIELNIWTKWYERSFRVHKNHYRYFLRSRVHMGSHFAGIARYLNPLTHNDSIKAQTAALVQQYDTLLKRNLKLVNGGYIWNSTYDNVNGTFAAGSSKKVIQDVSHGNHVVTYILNAYAMGDRAWTPDAIKRLCITLKKTIYDNKKAIFHDNVDGTDDPSRPGWGNFIADGWIKLAAYDQELKLIFDKFENTGMLEKYNQEMPFKATMYRIKHANI